MIHFLIFIAVIICTCVFLNIASSKVGIPVLLAFILFGMMFGNNGFLSVSSIDYNIAEDLCSFALIFIMFYGGFGTNWKTAKSIAVEAGLLASVGVFITAIVTGCFCHYLLHWKWAESLLMGGVVSSTDAASVFSILRSHKLGLKNNTAPLLEVESGSNDPCSYMMTAIMMTVLTGDVSAGHIVWMLFSQIFFGILIACIIAHAVIKIMSRISFETSGFTSLFFISVAIFSYAIPMLVGGNGYLSAYLVGIVIGNAKLNIKKDINQFFDGLTSLMQVLIFFLLGMLCNPADLPEVFLPALVIFIVMTFVSRPLAVMSVLTPFRKYEFKQQLLTSFAGLRGAASIVFAIMATVGQTGLENDILNIVFCIVLISILLQGSLLPAASRKLDMIDKETDVMKTFTDFSEESNIQFSNIAIGPDSPWRNKYVRELCIPRNMLLCLNIKPDGTSCVPKGNTLIEEGDQIIMCTNAFIGEQYIHIIEHPLSTGSKWTGHAIKEYPKKDNEQLVMIRRNGENIIPHGGTVLMEGDILYINKGI